MAAATLEISWWVRTRKWSRNGLRTGCRGFFWVLHYFRPRSVATGRASSAGNRPQNQTKNIVLMASAGGRAACSRESLVGQTEQHAHERPLLSCSLHYFRPRSVATGPSSSAGNRPQNQIKNIVLMASGALDRTGGRAACSRETLVGQIEQHAHERPLLSCSSALFSSPIRCNGSRKLAGNRPQNQIKNIVLMALGAPDRTRGRAACSRESLVGQTEQHAHERNLLSCSSDVSYDVVLSLMAMIKHSICSGVS